MSLQRAFRIIFPVFFALFFLASGAPAQDPETTASSVSEERPAPLAPYDPLALIPDYVSNRHYPGYLEDLKKLKLSDNVMPTDEALPAGLGVNSQVGLTSDLLRVSWRPQDAIDLYVIKPLRGGRPHPVIFLYSAGMKPGRFKEPAFGSLVTSRGLAAVGFIYAKSDYRIEYGPSGQNYITNFEEALVWTVHDIQKIIDYLEQRGDLDTSQIAIHAEGSGAAAAILASTVDPRITVLQVVNPWGDWPEFFARTRELKEDERAKYTSPDFLKSVAPLDPVQAFPKIQAKHARLLFIRDNPFVPEKALLAMEKATPASVEVYDFADAPGFRRMFGSAQLLEWIHDQMKPNAPVMGGKNEKERVHVIARAVEPLH